MHIQNLIVLQCALLKKTALLLKQIRSTVQMNHLRDQGLTKCLELIGELAKQTDITIEFTQDTCPVLYRGPKNTQESGLVPLLIVAQQFPVFCLKQSSCLPYKVLLSRAFVADPVMGGRQNNETRQLILGKHIIRQSDVL